MRCERHDNVSVSLAYGGAEGYPLGHLHRRIKRLGEVLKLLES
jgi:hypothetical protein